MIMQSYDFYYMFQHNGCNMQFGGNDQWSNMLGGTELIRRKLGKDAHAMTITLLTDSQGNKMGKTAGNAVWLDPNKTSPFEFYQYWRNIDDADVLKCIRMLTFLPLEEIDKMSNWEGAQLNEAKDILAYELTKLVHGEDEAEKARAASKALFSGSGDTEHMPTTELTNDDFGGGTIDVLTLLVKCGLAASKGEARRLVQQGGVAVNDQKVSAIETTFGCEQFTGDGVIIKKGKRYSTAPFWCDRAGHLRIKCYYLKGCGFAAAFGAFRGVRPQKVVERREILYYNKMLLYERMCGMPMKTHDFILTCRRSLSPRHPSLSGTPHGCWCWIRRPVPQSTGTSSTCRSTCGPATA